MCFYVFFYVHNSSFVQQYSPTQPVNYSTAGHTWQKNNTKARREYGGRAELIIHETWNTHDDVLLCPDVWGAWVVGRGFTTASLHELISLFIHLTFSRGWGRSWWAGVARLISCSGSCCWLISPSTGYPDLANLAKMTRLRLQWVCFIKKQKNVVSDAGHFERQDSDEKIFSLISEYR